MVQCAAEVEKEGFISVLDGHLESASHGSWQGAWLPRQTTCALACLVTACALRPGVEVKQALALVQCGLDHAQQGLDAEAVEPEVRARPFQIQMPDLERLYTMPLPA